MPKVSIIVPVYNVEQYLCQCLDSILVQTFTDWECILVDDGSTDNSGIICEEYAKKDRRFNVIHKENGGVSSARNKGIDEADGEFVTFVDADDYLAKTFLEECIEPLKKKDALVATSSIRFDASGMEYPFTSYTDNQQNVNSFVQTLGHYVSWSYIYDKSLLNRLGLRYKTKYPISEDAIFLIEYLQYVPFVYTIHNPLYFYRLTPESASNRKMTYQRACLHYHAANELKRLERNDCKTFLHHKSYTKAAKFQMELFFNDLKSIQLSKQDIVDVKTKLRLFCKTYSFSELPLYFRMAAYSLSLCFFLREKTKRFNHVSKKLRQLIKN